MATELSENFSYCRQEGKRDGITDMEINVHKVDALLTFAQGAEGRKGSTIWVGCPGLPEQLLKRLQSGLEYRGKL